MGISHTDMEYMSKIEYISQTLLSMGKNFNNFDYRQKGLEKLKKAVGEFWEILADKRGPYARLVVGIEDTIKNLRSEYLTLEQLKTIEEVTLRLKKEVAEEDVKLYLSKLIDAGLVPIPRLEKLAEVND